MQCASLARAIEEIKYMASGRKAKIREKKKIERTLFQYDTYNNASMETEQKLRELN